MDDSGLYHVWRVTYGACSEPDVPPRLVSTDHRVDDALQLVGALGFDHCAVPVEVRHGGQARRQLLSFGLVR